MVVPAKSKSYDQILYTYVYLCALNRKIFRMFCEGVPQIFDKHEIAREKNNELSDLAGERRCWSDKRRISRLRRSQKAIHRAAVLSANPSYFRDEDQPRLPGLAARPRRGLIVNKAAC